MLYQLQTMLSKLLNSLLKRFFITACLLGYLTATSYARPIPKEKISYTTFKLTFQKEKKDTKDSGLLKRLSDALKFTKNSRSNEQNRIIKLIDSLVIKNDKIATSKNIEQLKAEVSSQQANNNSANKAQYIELLGLIQKLQSDLKEAQIFDPNGDETPDGAVIIEDLVAKIIPILTSVKNNESMNAARQKRIRDVRDFYGKSNKPLDTVPASDSTAIIYELSLKHLSRVIGFVDQTETSFANYNFKALSGVAIHAYQLKADGNISALNAAFNKTLIREIKKNRKAFYLSLFASDLKTWESFLNQSNAQNLASEHVMKLLKETQATGINITLEQSSGVFKNKFFAFIKLLSQKLKSNYPVYQLSLTLPGNDWSSNIDVKALDEFVNVFIINFSNTNTTTPGPIAPLTGPKNNTLQASVSRMLNRNINPKKIVYALPYQGVKWSFNAQGKKTGQAQFLDYKTIRSKYQNTYYNLDSTIAFATASTDLGTDTVWYDDENTLSKKYDYLLSNNLGGAAIWLLGDDDGYGELWDAITDKFVRIDSLKIATISYVRAPKTLSFLDHFSKYYFLFEQPCETEFDKKMLLRLGITEKENQKLYNYTVKEAKFFLLVSNIVLGLMFLISIIILVYFIKQEGEWWPWRKHLLGIIIFIVLLFILSIFLSIYLNDGIPWFGSSDKECINMPFHILLGIITAGIVLGILIMRFLINPFLRQQEIP